MTYPIEATATKPEDLSLIRGTHMVERTNTYKLSFDLYMHNMVCKHTHKIITFKPLESSGKKLKKCLLHKHKDWS